MFSTLWFSLYNATLVSSAFTTIQPIQHINLLTWADANGHLDNQRLAVMIFEQDWKIKRLKDIQFRFYF